jgi:hypothetical protein
VEIAFSKVSLIVTSLAFACDNPQNVDTKINEKKRITLEFLPLILLNLTYLLLLFNCKILVFIEQKLPY